MRSPCCASVCVCQSVCVSHLILEAYEAYEIAWYLCVNISQLELEVDIQRLDKITNARDTVHISLLI
jgi:hypothetical protein